MKKLFSSICFCILSLGIVTIISCSSGPKVTLTEDVETYTMDNGIVKVRISKVTGDLVSFRYNDVEMFATTLSPDFIPEPQGNEPENNPNWLNPSITGRGHGYWSHDVMGVKGSAPSVPSITIDPKTFGGRMAEVSMKANSEGRRMGTGPGSNASLGDVTVDIDIRYTLERGSSGVYTYCIFNHQSHYPLAIFTEARYCVKLAPFFDWMSIDKDVNFHYPKDHNAGDKYVYTVLQSENPAFGWSSTTDNTGLFFINPSMEYLSGGPTKVEFLGHRNTDKEAAPCVLNYWRSSHYGGAEANIAEGEVWNKIIGPFFIYVNTGTDPQSIYEDAKSRAVAEAAKWPYKWVDGVDYPKAQDRAVVKGQIVLNDNGAKSEFMNMNVGLTAGEYVSPRQNPIPVVMTNWQRDAKFYQFWTKANTDGTFEIAKVRPGKYTLNAFADGILGGFVQAGVDVEKGKPVNLGQLTWTPVRKGVQLWDIGIPNRNASEFFKATEHRQPDISLKYAELFPDDITYTISQSDFSKDWFFQHVPHNTDPEIRPLPFWGIRAIGKATPYAIVFDLPSEPRGKAILRFAICGTGAKEVDISVNGTPAGKLENLSSDGVISNHGSQGIWYEKDVEFETSLLKSGSNTLVLTVPEGPVNNGIIYDYIRLELAEQDSGIYDYK